jgi:hypothetical protein
MTDWANKYRGRVARIAALLYMVENPEHRGVIGTDLIDRAIEIGRYALEHAQHALEHEMTADQGEDMARLLLAHLNDPEGLRTKAGVVASWPIISERQVRQNVRGLKPGGHARAAIAHLVERGYLAIESREKGSKADRYRFVGAEDTKH